MKEVLKRLAALAYLELDDALKLEDDIRDMISMAECLSKLQTEELDDGFGMSLENLREDEARSDAENNTPAFADGLCVPRIKGV